MRLAMMRDELLFQKVAISFRQGIFFAVLLDGILLLQGQRLLTWYNLLLLIIGLSVAELFLISRKPARQR